MMRLFEHFPQGGKIKCPICGTEEDRPCVLLPIDGTWDGYNCEAAPTHAGCITDKLGEFRYHREIGFMYMRVDPQEESKQC